MSPLKSRMTMPKIDDKRTLSKKSKSKKDDEDASSGSLESDGGDYSSSDDFGISSPELKPYSIRNDTFNHNATKQVTVPMSKMNLHTIGEALTG